MSFYQLYQTQKLNVQTHEIWEFISSPDNLKEITPDYMAFDITSPELTLKMYPGMIISYKVRPLLNFNTTWVTEITQVKEKEYVRIVKRRIGNGSG